MKTVQNVSLGVSLGSTTLGLTETRRGLSELVNRVMYQGDTVVVEKQSKPAVAIVPLDILSQWKANSNRLFKVIDRIQVKNAQVDSEKVMLDVMSAQKEVRKKRGNDSRSV